MGTNRRVPLGVCSGIAALALVASAAVGRADVTTERPGSILILPKVVYQPNVRDTVIQISNSSNSLTYAKCYYINGAPLDPTSPPGPLNPPVWQITDFRLFLTRQQPTQWSAGNGRPVNPTDFLSTPGAGLDPGSIPPVPPGFAGELICAQVEASGAPTAGNALSGNASLVGPAADISQYNAIQVVGIDPDSNNALELNNVEYNACPAELVVLHPAEGATVGGGPASSRLTLVPCSANLEEGISVSTQVAVNSCDEVEVCISADFNVDCFFDARMNEAALFGGATVAALSSATGGPFKQTFLRPSPFCEGGTDAGDPCNPADVAACPGGTCSGTAGLLGVIETELSDGIGTTQSAANLHTLGDLVNGTTGRGAEIVLIGEDVEE